MAKNLKIYWGSQISAVLLHTVQLPGHLKSHPFSFGVSP